MKKTIFLLLFALVLVAGLFGQHAVATRAGYRTHQQLGVYVELGIANPISLYLMPSILMPRDDYDHVSLAMGARFYPLDLGDLGFPGYPRNRRDFRHQISPFVSLGAQLSALTFPKADRFRDYEINSDAEYVLFAPIEVGVRWYLFRTLVLSKRLLLDNVFVEVPFGYVLNVSSLTGVLDYNDALDDEFNPFYLGISAGLTF